MKKRLLSAVLALAMVLTLLPATAFAVEYATPTQANPDSVVNSKTGQNFYNTVGGRVTTVNVQLCQRGEEGTTGRKYGHWYWLDNQNSTTEHKYYEVTSGIITGTGTSGQWYPDVASYARTSGGKTTVSSFTVLGAGTDLTTLGSYDNTSLTLVIANATSNTLTIPDTLTQLNISGKFMETATTPGQMGQGGLAAINLNRSAYASDVKTGLTITANNINIGTISLQGRTNTLNLTDCTVGDVTLNGTTSTNATTGLAVNSQRITATRTTFGKIDILGDSSQVSLTSCNVTGDNTDSIKIVGDGSSRVEVKGLSSIGGGNIHAAARTKTGQYPSVTVSGGTVSGIVQDAVAGNANTMTINVSGTDTLVGGLDTIKANVTWDSSDMPAAGFVGIPAGSLTVRGANAHMGTLTLGGTDKTTLTISATNSTFTGITAANGNNLTISGWVGDRASDGGNDYGTLNLGTYAGGKVTGGTFAKAAAFADSPFINGASKLWLDTANIQFVVERNGKFDLYKKNELARAISDIGTTGSRNATIDQVITVVNQGNEPKNNFVLMNGKVTWARVGYNANTPLILPDKVNNVGISVWTAPSNRQVSIPAGVEANVPYLGVAVGKNAAGEALADTTAHGELWLNASVSSTAATKITKATVASTGSTPVQNQNVTATLNGNTINLSGAVTPEGGGLATVRVDLETDVVDSTSGQFIVLQGVIIDYNVSTKKASFNIIQPEGVLNQGAIVQDGVLVLNNGTGEKYTVTASLTESASKLGIVPDNVTGGNTITATVSGKLSNWTKEQKDDLIAKLTTGGASFTYGNNRAMQQAINAAQATITSNNSVDNWVTNAKNNIWRNGFKSPDTTLNTNYGYVANMAPNNGSFNIQTPSGGAIAAAFTKAYIVPYLVVNVTDYSNSTGTLSATLAVNYRVDVSGNSYNPDMAYTVQPGRALSLTGDMFGTAGTTPSDQIRVKFNLGANFETKFMHQDGKYVYTGTAAAGWPITHAGANGTLGTIEINGTAGLISFDSTAADKIANRVPTLGQLNCTYDTLQAAIDDTARGYTVQNTDTEDAETMDTVVIGGAYKGDCAITMSGVARKVFVRAEGQQNVTTNTNNVDVQSKGGYRYLVELKQDVVAAGTVAISAVGTVNGTVSLSATSAKVGQTVTVTVVPSGALAASGITVRTNTGANVAATSTGVTNQFRFVVPSGATSITVTPNFGQTVVNRNPVVTVTNAGSGSGTAVTSAGSNQVAPGTLVTVTTSPGANQRTMGVNVSGATATRTGANTFQFIVPSGVTNVTVTPRFDANNGTLFEDVWSTEYYSNPVRWAVERGITNGDGSEYRFGTGKTCTREDMVTFLWRAAGSPTVTGVTNPFWDVQPGTYYYNAVLWAVRNGITKGVSTNQFGVGQTVIRADAVTFLYRYAGSPNANASSGFGDVSSNEYYAKPVTWAVGKGITNGDGSTTVFNPGGACLREQIVTFLYRNATGNRA